MSEDPFYEETEEEKRLVQIETNQTDIRIQISKLEERVKKMEEKLDAFIEMLLVKLTKMEGEKK